MVLKHDHAKRNYEHPRSLARSPAKPPNAHTRNPKSEFTNSCEPSPDLLFLLFFFFLRLLPPPSLPIAHRRRRQISSPTCCINARLYIHLRLHLHLPLPLPWKQKRPPLSRFILGTINPSTNRLSIPIAGFCASRTTEPLSAHLPSFKTKIFCSLSACLPSTWPAQRPSTAF